MSDAWPALMAGTLIGVGAVGIQTDIFWNAFIALTVGLVYVGMLVMKLSRA